MTGFFKCLKPYEILNVSNGIEASMQKVPIKRCEFSLSTPHGERSHFDNGYAHSTAYCGMSIPKYHILAVFGIFVPVLLQAQSRRLKAPCDLNHHLGAGSFPNAVESQCGAMQPETNAAA
jgi:hypothetical protein